MRQFIKELRGKTIINACETYRGLLIAFTDGTACVMQSNMFPDGTHDDMYIDWIDEDEKKSLLEGI